MTKLALALVIATASTATAAPLDPKAIVASCGDGLANLDAIGKLERAEPIGSRPPAEIVELFGKKARAYLIRTPELGCFLVPVVGKPAVTKGNFGMGGKVAYGLTPADCQSGMCPTVVSIKTADDKLVDAVSLGLDCVLISLDKLTVFADHDNILAHCYSSGGADLGRHDYLFEPVNGKFTPVADAFAGIGWMQPPDEKQVCRAVPPGRIDVVTSGARPVLDLVSVPYDDDEKIKAAPDWQSGGCDQTVVHQRASWDAKAHRFVPAGKYTYAVAHKICRCEPQPR